LSSARSEWQIVLLVAAVQFVNVLDFMMVMPLGPDFAVALEIPTSKLGLVGGAYTAAAAVAGLAGSTFLDRFDRRRALTVSVCGLALATFAGGLAWDLNSLLAARVAAGAFGGPATALSMSIVADVVPYERRGKAMATVMGAFAVASVLGVPVGLELAALAGWRAPFAGVGTLTLLIMAGAWWLLPPLTGHLELARSGPSVGWPALARRPVVSVALLACGASMFANFSLVPNLAAYLQYNLDYPREDLSILYLVGGVLSFVVMQGVGRLVDRFGAPALVTIGCGLLIAVMYVMFIDTAMHVPVLVAFSGFMVASSFRAVALNTLVSRVPNGGERARFMSAQSAIQHMGSASGAMLSSVLLMESADHSLIGMDGVAATSISVVLLVVGAVWWIDAALKREDRSLRAA
jgi:predicted MFS family arabinose efflux permease